MPHNFPQNPFLRRLELLKLTSPGRPCGGGRNSIYVMLFSIQLWGTIEDGGNAERADPTAAGNEYIEIEELGNM